MANHIRRQVREALVTALTGLSTTGSRVYVNSDDPLADGVTSALRLRVGPEAVSQRAFNGEVIEVERAMTFTVTAQASGSSMTTVLNLLDTIAKEVENALLTMAAKQLGGLARNLQLVSTDTRTSGEANQYFGDLEMQLELQASVREGAPDTLA